MTNDPNGITDAIVVSEACETPETVPVVTNTQLTPETEALEECARSDSDFTWHEDRPPGPQTHALCEVLSKIGGLYRDNEAHLLWLELGKKPRPITSQVELEGFIREKVHVTVVSGGKAKGCQIPSAHLCVLLKTPALQAELPAVDHVTDVVTYNSKWEITSPGYNNSPKGERYFYTGKKVDPTRNPVHIREFLDAVSFKGLGDAANAAALALTVLLRRMFPGGKPFATVTANRSHAGKDTVLDFAAGRTRRVEVSWSRADWAVQNEAVAALADPCVGFLTLGNVRVGSGVIESSFAERIVTSPEAVMQSSKRRGDGYVRNGDFVVGCSANQGRFSTDLMNRSLPIRLELTGDIEKRPTPLGDLRHEYLREHKMEIEAELCGMIENWKDQGCQPDESVRHPMKVWAQTIGGILKANGFEGFLSNWALERSAQDRQTEALGILAHALQTPEGTKFYRVEEIVKTAVAQGVIADLIGTKHGMNEEAMKRDLGVVLSGRRDETVHIEVEGEIEGESDAVKSYRIVRERRRIDGLPSTAYMFEPVPGATAQQK